MRKLIKNAVKHTVATVGVVAVFSALFTVAANAPFFGAAFGAYLVLQTIGD